MQEILDIVNESDEIIGQESGENIHKNGLLHREVHVFFITPDKKVIFQHRAKDKKTFPDLLDATVGGHVEIGDSYEETAIKETEEETGIKLKANDLIPINKILKYSKDEATGRINNVFNSRYVYIYKGDIKDLRVEAGEALGFETWPLEKLAKLSGQEKSRFIPYVLHFSMTGLADFVRDLKIN